MLSTWGTWVLYIIVGAVAGWVAGLFVRGHGFGLWTDVIIGVFGSILGGFFLSLIGLDTFGIIGELVSSTVGAVVFLMLYRLFTARRSSR